MRLFPFALLLTLSMSGSAWAQRIPDIDNRVPELRVTELSQSGNNLKVTMQNVSTRTIQRVSAVLGKRKVDQDWSALAGGGVVPNATATLTISMSGLPAGGSRHHPAAPPNLELSGAVFADTGRVVKQVPTTELTEIVKQLPPAPVPAPLVKAKPEPISAKPAARVEPIRVPPKVEAVAPAVAAAPPPRVETAPPPTPPPAPVKAKPVPIPVERTARVEPNPGTPKVEAAPPVVAATPPPRGETAPPPTPPPAPVKAKPVPIPVERTARVEANPGIPKVEAAPPVVAATPPPRVQTAPPLAPAPAAAPEVKVPPREAVQQDQHPPAPPPAVLTPPSRPSGHPGTREQGVQDELSHLLSLVEPYEADLASVFPRTALRKMIAAVVAEQNVWAKSQPAVTPFDQGQRSAVETFVYGLQTIHERRDLDDETLRGQVQRFLKNRRQLLNR